MKRAALFLASFIGVLLLAVFLSPILFQVLPYKFERIFNRIVMIGTLVCMAVFVRIRRETFQKYGLMWKDGSGRQLLTAFLAPVIVLSMYVVLQIFCGEAGLSLRDIPAAKWIQRILTAVSTGLLIGTIEEFFFRGFVLQGTKEWFKGRMVPALILTNAFYSIVHFVHAKKPFVDQTPSWIDSLRLLGAPFQSLMHFDSFWTGFAGLFIFGLMLSGLTLRTKSLYPAVGLHAGAVFFIKTDGLFVNFGTDNPFWGSSKMYDGFLGWIALGVLYLLLTWCLRRGPLSDRGVN